MKMSSKGGLDDWTQKPAQSGEGRHLELVTQASPRPDPCSPGPPKTETEEFTPRAEALKARRCPWYPSHWTQGPSPSRQRRDGIDDSSLGCPCG